MKTKTKLKRENRKRLKTKMPKQQNLSLNEVLAYNMALMGANAVRRWIRD